MTKLRLEEFRESIKKHNEEHPELKNCIYPNCINKIRPTWDNDVLCEEHQLLMDWWFYEKDGYSFCPETWDAFTNVKLPKPKGSDANMTAYRKRYCDWIKSLSESDYIGILKHQIGDDE
jgi:aminoglycoside/choline kinase family phosphotransferase